MNKHNWSLMNKINTNINRKTKDAQIMSVSSNLIASKTKRSLNNIFKFSKRDRLQHSVS